jgi:hypothetical protein
MLYRPDGVEGIRASGTSFSEKVYSSPLQVRASMRRVCGSVWSKTIRRSLEGRLKRGEEAWGSSVVSCPRFLSFVALGLW